MRLASLTIALTLGLSAAAAAQQGPPPGAPPAGGPPPGARPPQRQQPERVNLVIAPDGNEARYRVRETLATIDFPTDAVGSTRTVTGNILVDVTGKVVGDSSKFTVDLRTIASDESRRDRFLQRNILKTDSFPEVVFVPRAVQELPRAPTATPASFKLVGDLTIHGVTRPSTWDVTVKTAGANVTGTATTSFAFSDFSLEVPRLAMLLSVKDTIRLEYDFHLVKGN